MPGWANLLKVRNLRQRSSTIDISQITKYLYISAWPKAEHAEEIRTLNVRLILSMHWRKPSRALGHPPVHLLWLPTIDTPLTPMPMRAFRRGVEAALPVIENGGSVLTHCKAGVHRGAAIACCVLVAMGYTAEGAIKLVNERRPIADPGIWYIRSRIIKFETYWHEL